MQIVLYIVITVKIMPYHLYIINLSYNHNFSIFVFLYFVCDTSDTRVCPSVVGSAVGSPWKYSIGILIPLACSTEATPVREWQHATCVLHTACGPFSVICIVEVSILSRPLFSTAGKFLSISQKCEEIIFLFSHVIQTATGQLSYIKWPSIKSWSGLGNYEGTLSAI